MQTTAEIHGVVLVKGKERYIILFTAVRRSEALRALGRWAADPELSFTWYNAARLSQKIREAKE